MAISRHSGTSIQAQEVIATTNSTQTLHYRIAMEQAQRHRFQVRIAWAGTPTTSLIWALPVWTPGSYLVREFAKNISTVRASSQDRTLAVQKIDKASWLIEDREAFSELTLDYEVFAYELSVRTSYLDSQRGYFNGANVFLYPLSGGPSGEWELEVQPQPGWDVATGLEALETSGFHYRVPDYDTLVDSPVECGTFQRLAFTAGGIPHEIALTGIERTEVSALLRDLPLIIEQAQAVFGGPLPYRRYTFLATASVGVGGGLEHRNSCSILFDRFMLGNPKPYTQLLSLFAHEYFHTWNVKRLRPENLGPFDYQHEVYTPLLWVLEGWTDYYAWLLLSRAGVAEPSAVLDHFADALRQLDMLPGRKVQTLADSSRDTWIKFYRPDGNTPNITVSYYHKGALAALFLDLALRRHTQGQASLDTVLRALWSTYNDIGYPETAVDDMIVAQGGPIFRKYLESWVYGTEDFDDSAWQEFGLQMQREFKDPAMAPAFTGIIAENGRGLLIRYVLQDSPAERAGIAPADEWVALDGYRIRYEDIDARLAQCPPGKAVSVSLFRQNQLITRHLTPEAPRSDRWRLTSPSGVPEDARARFLSWMGAPLP